MSTRKERKKKKLLLILVCCFLFGIGYYLLNEVSTWYEVPLGVTFHVISGCTLMASSGIYIAYTIKRLYFTKRSKRTKHIYLKDDPDKKSQ
jgi:membrane protease YdiL (CAAX protease family)